jgi:hypothetical protein
VAAPRDADNAGVRMVLDVLADDPRLDGTVL